MTNHEGKSVMCFTTEALTGNRKERKLLIAFFQRKKKIRTKLSTIRLLLQNRANFCQLMPDSCSPLSLAVTALAEAQSYEYEDWYETCIVELLQLMVQHGAMLLDSSCGIGRTSLRSGILAALATFDGRHEFIVDLFRAGAGFKLIAFCCKAVETRYWDQSICLCQAAVLAGYTPSARELQHLQLAAASKDKEDDLIVQLVNWLNEDRQQVPSLLRQSRVVIRRQLSVAVHFQTILPAIDKLPIPTDLKLYLQFDEAITELDLSINKEQSEDTSAKNSSDYSD